MYHIRNLFRTTDIKKVALYSSLAVLVLYLAAIQLSGCSVFSIPTPNLKAHGTVKQFIDAVEDNQPTIAFALLTEEAQSRIDYEQLSSAEGDFEGIVKAFVEAGITTRSKEEIPVIVSKLRGGEGALRFVLVQENGEWKIANIIEKAIEKGS